MAHDIAGLERKLRTLNKAIAKLHDAKHTDVLSATVHKPGWTSQYEYRLVAFSVDNLNNHVSALQKEFDALLTIAKKIGDK